MIIKRVEPVSLAKIMGALYFVMGLIVGLLISAVSILVPAFSHAAAGGGSKVFGMLFGALAFIALPLFYGTLGFVGGLLTAVIYNLLARVFGGIEMQIEGISQTPIVQGPPEGRVHEVQESV
jgi:hypothetical protein